jgi:hypothetical protein
MKDESTIDADGDGLAESLIIEIEILVYKAGSYGILGEVGQGITANAGPVDLGIGSNILVLTFSGGSLSVSSLSGKYTISVEAYSTNPDSETVKGSFTTSREYESSMFEAPDEAPGTTVSISGDEVLVRGEKMEVRVNMTTPRISFSYPERLREKTLSSISYLEVIAFNDLDDDGRWNADVDERRYSSDLTDVDWEIGTDFSRGFDIRLFGVLQLRLAGSSTAAAWARMTFTISSDHLEIDPPSQKFDIDIDLWQPLDAEMIAVKHQLMDETGNLDIIEGNGFTGDDHSLTVVKDKKRPYGTYSWTDRIEVGDLSADTPSNATSWYEISDGKASIWFSYPLSGNIQLVHHDPTLSMDPDLPPFDEEDEFLVDRPVLMFGGVMIGIALVVLTILGRKIPGFPGNRGGGD